MRACLQADGAGVLCCMSHLSVSTRSSRLSCFLAGGEGAVPSSKVPGEDESMCSAQYSGSRFSALAFDGARRFRLRSSCSITGTAAGMNSTPRLRLLGRA